MISNAGSMARALAADVIGGRAYLSTYATDWPDGTEKGLFVFQSNNDGQTFSRRAQLATAPIVNGRPDVLSDGTVVGVFFQYKPFDESGSQKDQTTSTAGALPRKGSLVAYIIGPTERGIIRSTKIVTDLQSSIEKEPRSLTDAIAYVAVDKTNGPFRDRIYVVWPEFRGGRSEIWLSHSADRGNTWTSPRRVSDDIAFDMQAPWKGPHDVSPALAVNRDGVVGVFWYDRRDNPTRGYWSRFTASLDGGETWLESKRVSEKPFSEPDALMWDVRYRSERPHESTRDRLISLAFGPSAKLARTGDTSGLTADASGKFHPVWIDDRTGAWQAWSSSVDVKGGVQPHVDVTYDIELEVGESSRQDAGAQTIVAQVRLKNTSQRNLIGPLELEWVGGGDSAIGTLADNADNRRSRSEPCTTLVGRRLAQRPTPRGAGHCRA
jgi:hypothetical protein